MSVPLRKPAYVPRPAPSHQRRHRRGERTRIRNRMRRGYAPVEMLVRAWGRPSSAGATPAGYISASAPGLEQRNFGPAHSELARIVRRVYEGSGNTIAVETYEDMPDEWQTGTTIYCRVHGADGATHRSHRANNWTGGPFVHYYTCEAANRTGTVSITIASPGVVTWAAHGLSNNTPILLSTTGALPTGLTAGTVYYTKSVTTNTFRLAATPGGADINTSGSQSGVHTITNLHAVQLGGDPWTMTRIDDRNFTLDSSVWKVRGDDPNPIFLSGVCYSSLVDAWPSLKAAGAYIAGKPGAIISKGNGFFALLAPGDFGVGSDSDPPSAIEMPSNSLIEGVSPEVSIFYRGDLFNAIPFRHFGSNNRVRNIHQIGNAPFQKSATHGFKMTSTSETRSGFDNTFENVWNSSIPGYVFNNGHPGGKVRLGFFHIKTFGNNNDGTDIKGAQDTNPDGAYANIVDDFFGISCGMGTVGTNKQAPIVLPTDPITTTNSSPTFTINLGFRSYTSQRVNFPADAPSVNGLDFAGRSFAVVSRSGNIVTCTHNLSANASSAGGGAGIMVIAPFLNKGKPLFDFRAEGWRANNLKYIDVFGYSTGARVRGGTGTNNNGTGGHNSVLDTMHFTSLANDSDDVDGEAFKGFTALGKAVQASNLYVNGNGKGTGITLARGADYSSIRATVENCAIGCNWVSSNADVKLTAITCATDVNVDGGNEDVTGVLSFALSIDAGSQTVTLEWAGAPTSLVTGKTVLITGAEIIGGIVNVSGVWTVTKVSAGIFTFNSGQTATETTTNGGGESIQVTARNVQSPNSGNTLSIKSFGCTGTSIVLTAAISGFHTLNSRHDGSGTAVSQNALATGIKWGPGNDGYPNQQRSSAPVTKTANFTVAESDNWLINNKSGSACTVTLPAASSCSGREITIKTIQAQTVDSASSNVVPLAGGSAGTAILSATAGKWATLVSDGTNWQIMAGN